jgi:uncharacterized protein DUF3788
MALSALDDPSMAPTEARVAKVLGRYSGHFLASLALGEKACAAARAEGLPDPILRLIAEAPKYPEGRGVRITVRTAKEARDIPKLVAIKLQVLGTPAPPRERRRQR